MQAIGNQTLLTTQTIGVRSNTAQKPPQPKTEDNAAIARDQAVETTKSVKASQESEDAKRQDARRADDAKAEQRRQETAAMFRDGGVGRREAVASGNSESRYIEPGTSLDIVV